MGAPCQDEGGKTVVHAGCVGFEASEEVPVIAVGPELGVGTDFGNGVVFVLPDGVESEGAEVLTRLQSKGGGWEKFF